MVFYKLLYFIVLLVLQFSYILQDFFSFLSKFDVCALQGLVRVLSVYACVLTVFASLLHNILKTNFDNPWVISYR